MHSKRTPSRAATYIRVSSEEQVEGYSLDTQTRAVKLYAEAHEWEIVVEYRDEGKSARTDDLAKRPAFAQMLEDAEASLFDVLVVHKLDRFARNRTVAFSALDRLSKLNVGFVSISENMDFSTAMGQFTLTMFVRMAQFYSDNLSFETKKGKQERKRQGFYNGLLPFGTIKGEEGIPVPKPESYPGLLLAFQSAAEGNSDREVADILNAAGYRTSGNRGANPFTKDSVRPMLLNRFYLGELPDGAGGWLPAKHEALIPEELFDAAMEARRRRTPASGPAYRRDVLAYSLSGLGTCSHCGGRMHIASERGKAPRIYCYKRRQGLGCPSKTTYLDHYEDQIAAYLRTFYLPADYRDGIMSLYAQTLNGRSDNEHERREIEQRLERIKNLYTWGDLDPQTYQLERDDLAARLTGLTLPDDQSAVLARTAEYLADLPAAWGLASSKDRNALARILFVEVRINDNRVEAVKPQPDFAPFFALDYVTRAGNSGSDGLRISTFDMARVFRLACLRRTHRRTRLVGTEGQPTLIVKLFKDAMRPANRCGNSLGLTVSRTRQSEISLVRPPAPDVSP